MRPDSHFRFDILHGKTGVASQGWVAWSLSNRYVLLAIHTVLFALTWFSAFALRFGLDFDTKNKKWNSFYINMLWFVPIKVAVFYLCRHYRDVWYYTMAWNIQQLVVSSSLAVVSIFAFRGFFLADIYLSRSIPVLDAILTIFLIIILRLSLRYFREEISTAICQSGLQGHVTCRGEPRGQHVIAQYS